MKKTIIFVVTVATTLLVAAYFCSKRANSTSPNALLRANIEALTDADLVPLCGWDPSRECVYDFGNGDVEVWEGVKIGED